ncbi:MAG TPA: PDZ domain-containing protein [Pyrinomonadaceae bacterium]|jgi:membrane-associated protease RseP (regulator of RpoE activity)|nr:PDZ domain-containing protein [Pyrinomonadaceae bacterium]
MTLRNAFSFIFSLVLTAGIVLAQQVAPAPPAGEPALPMPPEGPQNFSFFISGGSFLGVYTEDVSKDNMSRYNLREVRGVGITQVAKDSPAEKAGLRKDDVILRFDGESVTSTRKLSRLVSEVAPDQTVRLTISRGGAEQEVSVTIGKRNESMNAGQGFRTLPGIPDFRGLITPEGRGGNVWKWETPGQGGDGMFYSFGNNRRIGVSTMALTKQLADYFGIADGQGVLVTSVVEDSPAAKAGIKAGDVITAIDGEKVDGAGDVARGINKKKEGDVTLTVVRKGNQRTINVTPNVVKPMTLPGATPQSARRIVIPRIELGSFPQMNISLPRIDLPSIPQINVQLPKLPKLRVIRGQQPI